MARWRKRRKGKPQELGVIWEIPDELWERIEPILLEYWPRKPTGRRTADWRKAINGIIFRMRSSCQWNKLPRQFGDDSTVHRWFQRWCKDGVMEKIWAVLVQDCEELGGVSWEWQAADGAMAKARFGGKKRAEILRIAASPAPSGV
jgi:putative transposase